MTPLEMYMKLREEISGTKLDAKESNIRVIVQFGICSQAAGALDVIKALEEAVFYQGFSNVTIEKTGCGGFCAYEPLVTIEKDGEKPVTYYRVTPERAKVLLSEYVLKDHIVEAWTLNGKDVLL